MTTFALSVLQVPPKLLKEIDKCRSRFLWKQEEAISGASCKRYPNLFHHSRRKNMTVYEALHNHTWISDLEHGDVNQLLPDFLQLHQRIREANIILNGEERDQIRWNLEAKGGYTANSAYKMQFQGRHLSEFDSIIWKT
ncbi:uncharacterized protein [Aegilops tauschii subsp. strangulata]|uniref:uncharacterized protein n=1 Tax=Aegilops tauschii subsp. strangulata TaxID=200361 RepID=UPI00098A6303